MIELDLKVTEIPRVGTIGYTPDQMQGIADSVVAEEKRRLEAGLNRFDQQMEPLAESYKKRKTAKGKSGIRDMRLTGNMLGSLQVTEATAESATVDFRGRTPLRKAFFRQKFDQFHGLSESNFRAVNSVIEGINERNLREVLG